MPKFLVGQVIVKVYETYADDEVTGREFIEKWQTGDSEEPETGVKVTRYKMGWEEFNLINPTEERDKVLASFLQLMQVTIPGMPTIQPPPPKEKSRILLPFKKDDSK